MKIVNIGYGGFHEGKTLNIILHKLNGSPSGHFLKFLMRFTYLKFLNNLFESMAKHTAHLNIKKSEKNV
jgi:hypothetical protein